MSAATRPFKTMRPRVGAVMPESSLNSVLFPAPLRPITPSDVPRGTSRVTSRRAQNFVAPRVELSRYSLLTACTETSGAVIPCPPSSALRT